MATKQVVKAFRGEIRYKGKIVENRRVKVDEEYVKIYKTIIKKLYNKKYEDLKLDDTNSVLHYLDSACTAHLTS